MRGYPEAQLPDPDAVLATVDNVHRGLHRMHGILKRLDGEMARTLRGQVDLPRAPRHRGQASVVLGYAEAHRRHRAPAYTQVDFKNIILIVAIRSSVGAPSVRQPTMRAASRVLSGFDVHAA
ncbi:hypothetical protein B1H19_01600 [Streptomyces gilvosporeus]|uniref:Uncharacterized protein n=1 Tax=Streptomyces gilvosporeus TaxID=553510 RepID=A0A1V0TJE1_9ACTN|nr:hypothetical protein B1H19_01600 [Streptomyces gilvosporeus]